MTPTPQNLLRRNHRYRRKLPQPVAGEGEGLGGMDKEGEKEVLRFERVRVGTNGNRVGRCAFL